MLAVHCATVPGLSMPGYTVIPVAGAVLFLSLARAVPAAGLPVRRGAGTGRT